MPTSLVVLGQILAEARRLVGRSPEQVGLVTGLSGRTIRRLEAGAIAQPHKTTLEALAEFYALDGALLRRLVELCDLGSAELLSSLRQLDEGGAVGDLDVTGLAMRIARRGVEREVRPAREWPHDPELAELAEDFLALDRRRRTFARLLLRDLRKAGESEHKGAR